MIAEHDLPSCFGADIKLFPYVNSAKDRYGPYVRSIQLTSFDDFLAFCKSVGVSILFYEYTYLPESAYHITDEMIHGVSTCDAEFNYIKAWADKENAEFDNRGIDVSRAICFVIETMDGVGYVEVDDWYSVLDIVAARERLDTFCETHEDELVSLCADDGSLDDMMGLQVAFEDALLGDADFRLCKNKDARRRYLSEFIKKSENKKYCLLGGRRGTLANKMQTLWELCDRIYDRYRVSCRELKLHIGDALPDD